MSIRQETISAVQEAMPCIIGTGREWVKGNVIAEREPRV